MTKVAFKKMIKYFLKEKKLLFFSIIFSVLNSLCLVFGALISGEVTNYFFEKNNFINNENQLLKLTYSCLMIIGIYILYFLFYYLEVRFIIALTHRTGTRIRKDIFINLLNSKTRYIEMNSVGEIISKSTADLDLFIINICRLGASLFISPFVLIVSFLIMFLLAPLLGIIYLVFSIIIFLSTFIFSNKSKNHFMEQQESIGELSRISNEHISNKKSILIMNKIDWSQQEFNLANNQFKNSMKKAEYSVSKIWPFVEGIENFMIGILFGIGVLFMTNNIPSYGAITKDINIGIVITFLLLTRQVNGEIGTFSRMLSMIEKVKSSFNRINSLLEIEVEDDDNKQGESINLKGNIEFDNVSFGYYKNRLVLNSISLNIKKGERVAFVGETGSGKSTIISLLMRYFDDYTGEIKIDGKDIKSFSKSELRKNISVVFQDTFLFNETIKDNISFGKIDATEEEIITASKEVNLDHFVNLLNDGYNQMVDQSITLSHGQQQLLSLARAYISKSPILILDEATSSIDPNTEKIVQNGLEKLMKNKTCIIIAHRLSTIINCDKIIVLKNGEIVEIGNHKSLLKKKGAYYKLYNSSI